MSQTQSLQAQYGLNYEIEVMSREPGILRLRGFLSDEECDHLIELGRDRIKRSSTVNPDTGEIQVVDHRTSYNTYLTLRQTPMVTSIEERLAHLAGLPVENGEALQILRYDIGQYYKPHYDFFDPGWGGSAKILECGGQRVASCVMYLTTVEEGGETNFPEVNIKVPCIRGDAVFFFNILPDGKIDPLSMHESVPVVTGEKWASTKWIREREFVTPPA
jgi:prolyl 4-hydroxylase